MTGRTIPVTRTDGGEVASEATQVLIHDQLDLKSSEVVADLRGTGGKTLTDLWNELASTLAVSDSTSHTTLASILTALGPLATDAKLEAVRALLAGTLSVSGPLTDTQLRAAAVAISATSLPLPSGAATDAKLEAVRALLAGTLNVAGPLTDAQLRAAAVAISVASLPLPSGAATDSKLEAVRALLAGTLAVSASSLPLPSGAATSANQTTANTSLSGIDGGIGGASAAAAGDTGASTTNGFLRWIRDFWLALKGTKTAANSLSVTGASDGVFYVGGVSPDGQAPTNQAVRVSGIDGGGLKRTFLTDTSGRQYVLSPDSYSISSATALGALNDVYPVGGLALPSWARSAVFYTYGTFSATVQYNLSFDGGASFVLCTASRNVSAAGGNASAGPGGIVVLELPPGATHIQVKCSSYTSGTAGILLAYSAAQVAPYIAGQIGANLTASNARVGSVQKVAVWTRESTTPVNANQSITGANKTTFNTSSGTALNTATSYGDRFCAYGGADVAGTLIIEASPDTGTTWYPVTSVALAQVGASGNFGAYLDAPIVEATMRGRLLNGGTNQARAVLLTKMIG